MGCGGGSSVSNPDEEEYRATEREADAAAAQAAAAAYLAAKQREADAATALAAKREADELAAFHKENKRAAVETAMRDKVEAARAAKRKEKEERRAEKARVEAEALAKAKKAAEDAVRAAHQAKLMKDLQDERIRVHASVPKKVAAVNLALDACWNVLRPMFDGKTLDQHAEPGATGRETNPCRELVGKHRSRLKTVSATRVHHTLAPLEAHMPVGCKTRRPPPPPPCILAERC